MIFNYNRWFVKKINDNRMIAKKTTAVKKRNTLFQIANTSCLLHATRCNRNIELSCFLIFNMWKIPTQMKSFLAKLNFVHDWLSKKVFVWSNAINCVLWCLYFPTFLMCSLRQNLFHAGSTFSNFCCKWVFLLSAWSTCRLACSLVRKWRCGNN